MIKSFFLHFIFIFFALISSHTTYTSEQHKTLKTNNLEQKLLQVQHDVRVSIDAPLPKHERRTSACQRINSKLSKWSKSLFIAGTATALTAGSVFLIKNQISQTGNELNLTVKSLTNQVNITALGEAAQIIQNAGPLLQLLKPFGKCFEECMTLEESPGLELCFVECVKKSSVD